MLDDALSRLNRSGFSIDGDGSSEKNKSIVSLDKNEFYELRDLLDETVIRIASEMRSGKIDAEPVSDSKSPCNYCKMASVCRRAKKSTW